MIMAAGGIAAAGPLAAELMLAIEYATGLGIGMADLPFEAIEWYAFQTAV